jgi:4Fe-4S ferredoxin
MDWFDGELSGSRGEPVRPDGAARASPVFEDAVPWWRHVSTRAFALAAGAVALVFAVGHALSGGVGAGSSSGASPAVSPPTALSGPPSMATGPIEETAGDPCRYAVRAAGSAPLIDDFEDGDELVALLESRNGYWVLVTAEDVDPSREYCVEDYRSGTFVSAAELRLECWRAGGESLGSFAEVDKLALELPAGRDETAGDCEGKRDCERVCPYQVFEVRTIDDRDFRALSFLQRLKVRAHGKLSAYTPRAAECHGCGLCVEACPEDAIHLTAVQHPTEAESSDNRILEGNTK